jgi:AmmeMemoRadiSam system protein B
VPEWNSSEPEVRPAAVAGLFYPGEPRELARMVDGLLDAAASATTDPKALIAPHAGYIYSGPVAATAYNQLSARRASTARVLLLGPSHRVAFRGLALSSATRYATPIGDIAIDTAACRGLLDLPQVGVLDEAHAEEHSLEVHLPFLRAVLDDFLLIPVVVGDASAGDVSEVIETFWGREDTLVVVSSDLSHFLDYETANRVDRETTHAIEHHAQDIRPEQACGCRAINGLMRVAEDRALEVTTLDLRNSGDTAGDRSRVVGYGAYALT